MAHIEKALISIRREKISKLTKTVVDEEIIDIYRMLSRSLESLASIYKNKLRSKGTMVQNNEGCQIGIYTFCGKDRRVMVGLTLEGTNYLLSVTSESEKFSKQLMNHIIYVSEFIPKPISYSQGEVLESILEEIFDGGYNK